MKERILSERCFPSMISEIQESVENSTKIHNAIVTMIATLDTGTGGWVQTSTSYTATASYDYQDGDYLNVARWNAIKTDMDALVIKVPALRIDLLNAQEVLTNVLYKFFDDSTVDSFTLPTLSVDTDYPTLDNWNDLTNAINQLNEILNKYYSFAYYLVDDILAGTVTLPSGWENISPTITWTEDIPNKVEWDTILTKYNGSYLVMDFTTSETDFLSPVTKGRYLKTLYLDSQGTYRAAIIDIQLKSQLVNVPIDYTMPSGTVPTATSFNDRFGGSHATPSGGILRTYQSIAFDSSYNVYVSTNLLREWHAAFISLSGDPDSLIWYGDYFTYKYNSSGVIQWEHTHAVDELETVPGSVSSGDIRDEYYTTITNILPAQAAMIGTTFVSQNIITHGYTDDNGAIALECRIGDLYISDAGTTLVAARDTFSPTLYSGDSMSSLDYTMSLGKFYYNNSKILYYIGFSVEDDVFDQGQDTILRFVNGNLTSDSQTGIGTTASSVDHYASVSQYINFRNPKIGAVAGFRSSGSTTDSSHIIITEWDLENDNYTKLEDDILTDILTTVSVGAPGLIYNSETGEAITRLKASTREGATYRYYEYMLGSVTGSYYDTSAYTSFAPATISAHINEDNIALTWDSTYLTNYSGINYISNDIPAGSIDYGIIPISNTNDASIPFNNKFYHTTILDTPQSCGTIIENGEDGSGNKLAGFNVKLKITPKFPIGTPAFQAYITTDFNT